MKIRSILITDKPFTCTFISTYKLLYKGPIAFLIQFLFHWLIFWIKVDSLSAQIYKPINIFQLLASDI